MFGNAKQSKKNEAMLSNATSNTDKTACFDSAESERLEHERWKVAMDANSVLGAITKSTLEQLGQLIRHLERLVGLLDECPISAGLESEWNDEYCEKVSKLAQEVEALAYSTRIPQPLIPFTGFYDTFGIKTHAYVSFLHSLRADRSTWLPRPEGYFGNIEALKFPDQLITFHQRVYEIYDRWTRVGDLRQAAGKPSGYTLSKRFDEHRVEELSKTSRFRRMLESALKDAFTDADQKELLGEITHAAVVYAKDFRLELHGIASVLVWIEAAKRYAHTSDNAHRMQHFALERELAKVWDAGRVQEIHSLSCKSR